MSTNEKYQAYNNIPKSELWDRLQETEQAKIDLEKKLIVVRDDLKFTSESLEEAREEGVKSSLEIDILKGLLKDLVRGEI